MRRGLRRADGFALFIAVCNSPVTVGELIRLTAEAMPEVALRTVELEADVADPLAAVLAQLPAGSQGPVMVRGLERSNPSTQAEHPVLRTLNLGRPEWPRKLPW
ncbi:MAG: hypothetical protein GY856_55010, partial [bacterium]|nr:hypothetical protein [bacterium]